MVSDGSRKIGLSLSRDQSLHCWHTHTLGKKLSYLIYVLYVCFGTSLRQYFTYYIRLVHNIYLVMHVP